MKIYTRGGDKGKTSLADGSRTSKGSHEINLIGEVDELNSAIGMILAHPCPYEVKVILIRVQKKLFSIGALLAKGSLKTTDNKVVIEENDVVWLEDKIDILEKQNKPLTNFILPGGTNAASVTFFARSICRRVERGTMNVDIKILVEYPIQPFLNRLSDLLFVIGRFINHAEKHKEIVW